MMSLPCYIRIHDPSQGRRNSDTTGELLAWGRGTVTHVRNDAV